MDGKKKENKIEKKNVRNSNSMVWFLKIEIKNERLCKSSPERVFDPTTNGPGGRGTRI